MENNEHYRFEAGGYWSEEGKFSPLIICKHYKVVSETRC